jgi:uncharacterized protein (DUF486 family)
MTQGLYLSLDERLGSGQPLSDFDIVVLGQQIGATWVTLDNAYLLKLLAAVLFFVIVVTLGLLAYGLVFLAKKLGQKVYDIKALALYNEIIEGRRKVFSVFLRPFYVTNRLFESGVSYPPFRHSLFLGMRTTDLKFS